MVTNRRAVSTLIMIIIILCAVVFGAFISYMWAIANFYLEPENTVDLVITDVNFQVNHADYFYVTIMNPSHSPFGTNITEIYLTVEGDNNLYKVTEIYPGSFPFYIEKGTTTTIKCIKNWSNLAGKNVTVNVSAENASGASRSVETEFVNLQVQTFFNATESIKYFDAYVKNDDDSAINLTLTNVRFQNALVENTSLSLPRSLLIGEFITFRCFVDWQGHTSPLVRVETIEGYFAEIRKNVDSIAFLEIPNISFNETDANKVNITFSNLANSTVPVDITYIVLTYSNKTDYLNGSLVNPALPYRLGINSTATFDCDWNWTAESYRDINVTINAYTKQGFLSQFKTVKTPSRVVARITDVNFDLDDTTHFLVNVTNMLSSLHEINVTKIMFNQNLTAMNSSVLIIGNQTSFLCGFNWTSFLREEVTIMVNITYNQNQNETSLLYNLTLPYYKIRDVSFSSFEHGNPYANITVYNSNFSTTNANITKIIIETENRTYVIDGTITNPKISPNGYILIIGNELSIVCPWDWSSYLGTNITVIIQTADGFQTSRTVQV